MIQDFIYTATGSEGSDFFITLPVAWANDSYYVQVDLGGVADSIAIDLPNIAGSDRTTTQFRVVTTASLQSGDLLQCRVFDPAGTAFDFMYDVAYGLPSAGSPTYSNWWTTVGSTSMVDFPLVLTTGTVITAVTFYYRRQSSGTISFTLYQRNTGGVAHTLLCQKSISSGSTWTTTEIGTSPTLGSLPQTIADGTTFYLQFSSTAANDQVSLIKVTMKPA